MNFNDIPWWGWFFIVAAIPSFLRGIGVILLLVGGIIVGGISLPFVFMYKMMELAYNKGRSRIADEEEWKKWEER